MKNYDSLAMITELKKDISIPNKALAEKYGTSQQAVSMTKYLIKKGCDFPCLKTQQILDYIESHTDFSIEDISKSTGCSHNMVYKILSSENIEPPKARELRLTAEKLKELYEEDPFTSVKEAAAKLGLKQDKVRRLLQRENIERKYSHRRWDFDRLSEKSKSIILYVKSHPEIPYQRIADKFGVSKQHVAELADKYIENNREIRKENRKEKKARETQSIIERLKEIYKENPSADIKDVANKLGLSEWATYNLILKGNVKRDLYHRTSNIKPKIVSYLREHPEVKHQYVAVMFGTSRQYVATIASEYKILKCRRKKEKPGQRHNVH